MEHRYRLESLVAEPLEVPLVEPFVIATGRVDVTPNVLVRVEVVDLASGARAAGLGEASTLPPVTAETQADVLATLRTVRTPIDFVDGESDEAFLDWFGGGPLPIPHAAPCARAGAYDALVDAVATLRGLSTAAYLAHGSLPDLATPAFTTDITIPIGDPAHMVALARGWAAQGFRCFKVKVGKDPEADLRALEGIHRAVPGATFRVDANAGFSATDALRVAGAMLRMGLAIECYEQPCGKDDLDGLARVTREVPFDVVADESCRGLHDVMSLAAARACDGVNLKLVKAGGLHAAFAAGACARRSGLTVMVGEMVETRLGTAAVLHLARALGGVDYLDLDTPLLLASDPFDGGYVGEGPRRTLLPGTGHGVVRR